MSRRQIPDLAEHLVLATISLGGQNDANVGFSTKSIATAVGVSEYALFSHFKTKHDLIEAALEKIALDEADHLHQYIDTKNPSFEDFTEEVIRYFLSNHERALFLINYSETMPQVLEDDAAFERRKQRESYHIDLLSHFMDFPNEEAAFLIADAYFRRVTLLSHYALSGLAEDNEEYRHYIAQEVIGGLSAFKENKV
jgi:AcrR family transcriptional regulator